MSRAEPEEVVTDHDLHAYVDQQLGAVEHAEVTARIATDAEARERVASYSVQKQLLRELGEALDPDVVNLRTAALERDLARRLDRRSWSPAPWMRQAAAAAVFATVGWFGHAQYAKLSNPLPSFVASAAGAHGVFGEDRARPVEFSAATIDDARVWLSGKLGRNVTVPALDSLGVKLVGARLLGTEEGPLAQFIYEDQLGHRMSLVIASHPENEPVHAVALASAKQGQVGYWSDGSLDYALVARTSGTQLRAIVDEVSVALSAKQASATDERGS